ncbi:MAG: hypothetical protein C0422_06895 [Alcaligenaceae bacterium]|nr:hypothetical protein [Alcaligenaceae bacterium]
MGYRNCGVVPNNALNYRSLHSLDSQKLRFWLLVSLIVRYQHGKVRGAPLDYTLCSGARCSTKKCTRATARFICRSGRRLRSVGRGC